MSTGWTKSQQPAGYPRPMPGVPVYSGLILPGVCDGADYLGDDVVYTARVPGEMYPVRSPYEGDNYLHRYRFVVRPLDEGGGSNYEWNARTAMVPDSWEQPDGSIGHYGGRVQLTAFDKIWGWVWMIDSSKKILDKADRKAFLRTIRIARMPGTPEPYDSWIFPDRYGPDVFTPDEFIFPITQRAINHWQSPMSGCGCQGMTVRTYLGRWWDDQNQANKDTGGLGPYPMMSCRAPKNPKAGEGRIVVNFEFLGEMHDPQHIAIRSLASDNVFLPYNCDYWAEGSGHPSPVYPYPLEKFATLARVPLGNMGSLFCENDDGAPAMHEYGHYVTADGVTRYLHQCVMYGVTTGNYKGNPTHVQTVERGK